MGMVVTQTEDKLCVELDSGTSQMDYLPYIAQFSGTPSSFAYKISETLTNPTSVASKVGILQGFNMNDPILIESNPIRTLAFANANIFGFCDSQSSPQFLVDQDLQSCSQSITSLQDAANSFMSPATYLSAYLTGSNPSSSLSNFNA